MGADNHTLVREFILLGLSSDWDTRVALSGSLCPVLGYVPGDSAGELPHYSSDQTGQPTPDSHVFLSHQPLPC